MTDHQALLKPFRLKHLVLRNRIFSTAHAPGYAEDGMPKERYQLYHQEKARGGLALTMFGGSSSIATDSPLSFAQIDVSSDRVLPYLREFADRIHGEGAAVFCQITHLGRRGRWDTRGWLPLIGPSANREQQHHCYAKEMEDFDFRRVIKQFADAAMRLKDGGLDGCELLLAAHQLIDSFLSPAVNQRTDRYGGSLENRMRFGMEVLEAIRNRVGDDFIVGIRFVGDELIRGGLNEAECLKIAVAFANSGLIDYLNVYQGTGDSFRSLQTMLPDMSYDSGAFLYLPSAIKTEVDIPVFHASAIRDLATAARAVGEGHLDMVAMTRGHIADPHLVNKMLNGREDEIRQCIGANYCVDRVDAGGAICIQNISTGREKLLPHDVGRTEQPRRVVVVGGGPGGLEAARVAAARGHDVVLFEREPQPGGQVQLARALSWRENMGGITRWLNMEVQRLGVDIRLGTEADREAVMAEQPDAVVIATGGRVPPPMFQGAEHAIPSWDILSGKVRPAPNVLLFDLTGLHQGATVAQFMAERGSLVEMVTPDQMIGEEIGGLARVHFMKRLREQDVVMTPGYHLTNVYREGNGLVAVLREEYSDREEEREVAQVVYEQGTLPEDTLYQALRPFSHNMGEVDYDAFVSMQPQMLMNNPQGNFHLWRIGDAVLSRNIHAAILDGSRFMRAL
ncbi:FAD-dependent oxidoreductase [Komagataeibacter sp. FNDCF1]|uniref:oxidoreductase n=1 Tax=Komagataeibacter sp. FNDCF1 TaxID=2878681 RepID=UPI001E2FDFD3|nr:FAD-dependent oxidoreductase [Komagataeibacter sp. FNDCF1]MCE2565251.1 NADH:flavin oxidoreductase [Komagataeibacter sp. FNDCF1]